MKRIILVLCCMLAITKTFAQTFTTIGSGTDVVNTGSTVVIPSGFWTVDGTYTDTTSPGLVNLDGGVGISGTGTIKVYNIAFINGGTSTLTTTVSVYNTATINSGTTVPVGAGNLWLRTDILPHYTTANLVVHGVLTGTVNGLVAYSTAVNGCGASYSPTLSTNVSGSVIVYQWESSPNNTTWTPVSGATNATYAPTVTANVYYRVNITTTNSAFNNNTESILLNAPTPNPVPTFTVTPNPVCTGTSSLFSGSGSYPSYTWSFGDATSNTGNNVTKSYSPFGNYTVTLTVVDNNSCSGNATKVVTVNPLPTVTVSTVSPICEGFTAGLTASGATSYTWDISATLSASTGASVVASPTVTTTYTVTGTDGNGCSSSATVTVSVNPLPVPTFTITPNPLCEGANGLFSGSGTYPSYTWSFGDATSNTGNNVTKSYSPFGNYTVTLTVVDNNSCSGSATKVATVNATPTVTVNTVSPICEGFGTTLNATGGTTYVWTPGTGLSATTGASVTASPTVTVTYTVTGTTAGCSGTATVLVSVNPNPAAIAGSGTTMGIITLIAGTGTGGFLGDGGAATAARLNNPMSAISDASGNIYVADRSNNRVRKVDLSGIITTIAGGGGSSADGIPATSASALPANDIVFDASGNLYIALPAKIRKIDGSGIITTIAGTGSSGSSGDGGAATAATFTNIYGLAFDPSGDLVVVDHNVNRVRKINMSTGTINTIAGTGASGTTGDGGPATAATFQGLDRISIDAAGNIYLSDEGAGMRIRKINTSGIITLVAGTSSGFSGDGGPATAAQITFPYGSVVDPSGNIYIADFGNNRIRKVDPSGIITTVAGTGAASNTGDGGPASAATLNSPVKLAYDPSGNLIVTAFSGNTVRRIALTTSSSSVCTGSSITVSNATSGGTWSSNNSNVSLTGTATTTVTVTGVSAGTSVLSYTLPSGCYAITTITVNTTPTPITGTLNVCVGLTTSLNSTPSGGTWTSGSANATVNSTTGVVTGVTPGTATITYTAVGGCYATAVVTVTSTPGAITGNTTLSTAITTTLGNSMPGGMWSSVTTSVATIGSTTGVVTGLTVGTSVISYSFGPGCEAITTVNVLAPQAGLSFDGTSSYVSMTTPTLSNFTLEYWVRNDGTDGGFDRITSTASDIFETAKDASGNISFYLGGWVSGTNIGTGVWSHLAWVRSGTTLTLYKNGVFVNSFSVASTTIPASWSLGRRENGGGENANMTLDEVRIWNVARTQPQIQSDMNCDVPQNANLKVYYRFNEGTPSGTNTGIINAYDYSGNGICGALNNFVKTGSTSNYVTGAVGTCNTITITTPAAITGNAPVCVGQNITLANANSGGVWTSGNTGTATVNSTTGQVTGVAAGTVNITYTLNCAIASVVVTVNALPVVTFTAQPGANACASTNVTYTTQSGMSNYIWGFGGTLGTDYNIVSGGTVTSNTAVLQYFTSGPHTVTINYTDANGCTAVSPTSSTPTTFKLAPKITNVAPLTAVPGSTVTITGLNFSTTPSNNIVYFGATQGVVTASATTSVDVTVPAGGTFWPWLTLNNTDGGCGLKADADDEFKATFTAPSVPATFNFKPRIDFGTGNFPNAVHIADFDNDGKGDIVGPNFNDGNIYIFRNTTSGGFSLAGSFTLPTGTNDFRLATGDIDGDGKLDIAVPNRGSNSLTLYRNTTTTVGTITFAGAVTIPTLAGPGSVVIGDFDEDGKSDLIVSMQFANRVSVFRNTGTPGTFSFAPSVDLTTLATPYQVAIGDIDGDDKPEIAVVHNTGSNNFSTFRNTSIPGTISVAARQDFATDLSPIFVGLNDLDGDGMKDVVTANIDANNMSVFRNTSSIGSISFAARADIATGNRPGMYSVADFDGDNKPDLCFSNNTSSSTSVFRNTSTVGSIVLSLKVDFPAPPGPAGIDAGDLNGDNKPDIVMTNQSSNNISVFINDPLQAITGPTQVCAGGTTLTTITLSNATPNGTWSSSNPAVATVGSASGIVTGVTAGTATITYYGTAVGGPALGNYTTHAITVNPVPVPTFTVSPGATTCQGASVTYATQGGQTNYVWSVPGTAGVDYIIMAGGIGTTDNTVTLQWYTSGSKVVTINYTSPDGCTNPTAASNTTTIQMSPTITSVTPQVGMPASAVMIVGTNFNTTTTNNIVYFGATRATVTSATTTTLNVTVPVGATFMAITVNNTGCALTASSLRPYLQTYNNSAYIGGTVNFDPKVDFAGATAAWGVDIGDMDGDGKADVIVGENGTNLIKVFRNTSTSGVINAGSFAAPLSFTANNQTRGLRVADVDADGLLDVLIEGTSSVSVFRNTSTIGSISFAAKVDFATGALPNNVAIDDIDGDGKLDMAVVNFTPGTVSVFRNTSTPGVINSGSFASNVDFTINANPQGVMIADIDGDGKKDVIASNRSSNSISILRNTAIAGTINSSSLAAKVDFTTGTDPIGLGIADYDGDGKLDISVANASSNSVSVFRNISSIGSISLAAKVDFSTGVTPWFSVGLGDIDGDGKPDMVSPDRASNFVSVFRNTATSGSINSSSFAQRVSFSTGTLDYSVAVGDIDGDGRADLVTANNVSNDISVLRNNPLQPITGSPTQVCAGGLTNTTTTYANATPNGTWSSSNPSIATVGSSTGLITGVSAGVATITYSGTAVSGPALGNYTTRNVTVNPVPVPTFIVAPGATSCVGDAVTYTTQNSQYSYNWSVPGSAGVDYAIVSGSLGSMSSTVTLKWLTAGVKTVTVNYSNVYGCTNSSPATNTVTVNPIPTTITGTGSICVGLTTTLNSTPSGGVWSSSNTSVATIGSTTGIVNGLSAGTAIITYTLPTGCFTARAIMINPLPPIAPTNTSPVCVGGLVNFAAGGFSVGSTTYAWTGPGGFTSTLANPGRSGVTLAHAGTYSLTAIVTSTGCVNSATTVVTINPTPTTTPTNTSPVCIGGTVNFNAVATAVGTITYSWTGPASFTSSLATPSRSSVTTAHAGSYVITVSTPGSGCITSATTIVTINPIPAAAPTNSSPVCVGTMITLSANPVSGTGVTGYSWTGPGGFTSTLANPTLTPTVSGTYSLTVTSGGASGCSPSTIYTTVVTVNPMPAAITATSSAICIGNTTTVSTTPAGGTWTSGSPSIASVGASSGVVTGLSAGTATITYTLSTGCRVSTVITVNPNPAAITGTAVMCVGSSTTLANTTSGGTWSSSNTGVATIGSTTGFVTGASAGTATISYTLPTGCFITRVVTVNGIPGTITGTMSRCVFASATLSSSPGGGTWTSSNTLIATIGSTSGTYTGASAGVANITYTLPTGCYNTATITINPNPAAITGVLAICAGSSTTLASATSGGAWSSGSPSVATIGSSSGVVAGSIPGTSVITYQFSTGCSTTATVTVNTMPTAIASVPAICVGSTTTLSSTPGGGTWSSSNPAMGTVSTSGVVTGISAGIPVITYTIGSCFVTRAVTINANPAAITGTTVLCMGSSASLFNATTGGTWTSSAPGVASIGSTSGLVTGNSTGTANITYTLGTGCFATTTVTVNTTPTPITGTMVYCVGNTGTLTATPGGGTWSSSSPAMATVSSAGVINALSAGTPVITYSFGTGCMRTAMITVNPNPASITGTLAVCVADITTLSSTTFGGTWSSGTTSVATVGSTTGIVSGVAGGTANITYTSGTGCYTLSTVTVYALPVITTTTVNVCVGLTATMTATPAGGTWSTRNGWAVFAGAGAATGVVTGVTSGVDTAIYIADAMNNHCRMTSPLTVNPTPVIGTSGGSVCVGTTTTLTATPAGGTWSSSSGTVTVGSTTGVVSGVGAGTAQITYTLPTGCRDIRTITVNSTPITIGGIVPVCVGGIVTLGSSPSGGLWSSSNIGVVTIGSTSGSATGVAAGTAAITYTLPTGCMTSSPFTVNPLPAAITGITNVCTGFTTALFNASTGGTWTCSAPLVAAIGSTSGVVTGNTAGTATITYTLPTGCSTTTSVTVNPTPVITAVSTICMGTTATLTATPAGGTWSSSNLSVCVVFPAGDISPVSPGHVLFSYSVSGCSSSHSVTVNPLPATITGPSSVCTGTSSTYSSASTGGIWSSSSGLITIGSTSGIVTGITSGTATITYTLSTGCMTTKNITINAVPSVITGVLTVCTGVTTTLNSTPSGGTWASSNPAEATIGSSTGLVTGISAGMPMITYTLATGCFSTAIVTVNPTPPVITGSNQVCIGLTTTLGNSMTGGMWSSSNPTVASVGSTTGIVTGNVAGTLNITYTMPTGCFNVMAMTVNALPSSITGTATICPGTSVTLSSSPTGGIWTSSNTAIATVGSTSGIVTGVAGGVVNISYTLATGCMRSAVVTVNPAPNLASFSPPTATSPCVGGSSVVTLNSTTIGTGTYTITYSLTGANTSSGNTATVNISSSTGSFTIPSALLPLTGAQNAVITAVTNSFGCTTTLSSGNVASFNVNVLPTVFAVTGGGGYCAGGTGVAIGLAGSTVGVNYQLFLGATAVGAPMAGTSTALTFGSFTTAGTYTIVATNATTGCVNNMSGSATVTVNPLPTPFTITGGGSYCAGGTGVSVGLITSQSGVNYQLYNGSTPMGSPVSGTGTSITFGLQTAAGTYTIVATNATTGCMNTMSGSVTVVVNPVPTTFTGAMVLCVGATTTLGSTPAGGTWASTSPLIASVGSGSGFVTGMSAGTATISYTLSTGCFRTGVMTINPNPATITGTMNVCVGSSVTLSSTTTGGTWTSSNPAMATVGSASGVVTGVSAGTLTITYTIATGCFVTANVTVNPVPAAITGSSMVCTGLSTTLSNTTTGGTWSSSASGTASVTSTGIVTGSAAGTVTISYTLSTGCRSVFPMTVNPSPASITGTMNVCVGSTRPLSNATSGGIWSSSNTTLANIGSSTGIVTGMAAGTVTITYMLSTGCFTTTAFTVNPSPVAITGPNNVCLSATIALSNTTSGGTWSSSASGTASITSTGIVTGAATGTATITYTIPGGCFAVYPVTVNPNPASITGTANVCVAASTTLSNATIGGTWTSSNPTVAAVGGGTGVVTGIAAGTATITYTIATGCFATRVVTVNPNPAAITGPTNVCTGLTITLANATTGGTWSSSNPLLGSINPTSGVVTGRAVGTPIMSYTLGTGCFATYTVVVNQTPDPIGGPSFVCLGSSITLTNTYGGGTWSSSNPSLASVVSATGVVTGNAVGLATITYSLPPGCISTTSISVNPIPATISGTLNVCVGSTTTLSNTAGGGTWSSSNPTIASVGGSTGMVSGGAAGTANITYTLPGGCSTVSTVTVNPLPSPILGTLNVCIGSSTTLSSTPTGGTWSSVATITGVLSFSSGTITGLSSGTTTVTYTLPTGCYITAPFTVNPLPASITGTAVVCVNATTTLSDATSGGIWSSSNTGVATIGSTSGVVTGISAGNAIITYTLPTGCFVTRIVTVNPLPLPYFITGGGGFCTGGSGVTIGLSGSNTGISYQLYNGTTAMGSPVAGTGASISFGLITVAGTYTVVATNTVTGCFVTMSGTTSVFGIPLPTAYAVTGGGAYCAGGSGFIVGLANSQAGVSYQLFNGSTMMGSPVTGTGSPISFGTQTLAGTYTVIATNGSGCVNSMSGSVNIVVNPLPTAFSLTGGGAYCIGSSGVAIGLSGSQTGVNYQLFRGITLVTTISGTGSPISFGSMTTAGTYTVVALNTSTGCTSTMTGSSVVVVSPLPTATYTVGGGGTFCSGGSGVNVTLSNSDAGVVYQLLVGGTPVGTPMSGIGSLLNFGPQTVGGVYTIQGTSTSTGCTATMTGSVNVVVNPLPLVYSITGGGSYCTGGTAPTIGLSNSQTGVNYQLIRDGVTVVTTVAGTTGSAISFGTQSVAGIYTVRATSTAGCISMMSGSAIVAINPLPTAFTVTGGGGYCTGGSGVAVMLSGSQSGVSYQLNNLSGAVGSPVSGTGTAISFGLQTAGSTYTVTATITSTGCTAPMAGSVVVTINPLPTPYTVTGGGAYCAGGSGAVVGLSNSQTNVSYQLFLGTMPMGSPVSGTSGSAISFGPQPTTGTYTVVATNMITGCVNNMTGSVTVSVTSLPSVYLVTGGGSYCAGGAGVAIGLSGSQTGVLYQLYNGTSAVGSPLAGTGGTLSFGLATAAGAYTVVATSTSACTNNMLGSVMVAVNPLPTPFTVTGGGSYCVGGSGVNVGLSSSSTGVSYQLYRGTSVVGMPVSGTGMSIDFGLMTVAGTYTVVATNTSTGCTASMTGTVAVTTSALPITYTVTGGGSFCSGSTGVTVGLAGSQTGVKYQLYLGTTAVGSLVTGTGSAISFGLQTTPGTYMVVATDTTTYCTRSMSGSVAVVVNALPNSYAVTGGGTFCSGASGASIGLTGSQTGVSYQLFNGSTAVGGAVSGTGFAISFGTFSTAGTYTVVATNTTTLCSRNMSGSATIVVNPLPAIMSVTGGGSYCAGSSGVSIGLTGSAVGVNYQLYRSSVSVGTPVAGTGSGISFGIFTTTGTYTVMAVDASTGCIRTMSGSATVSVTSIPTAFSVTGGGSYCTGGAGATVGLSGSGTGVIYQLYRGTTAVGSPVSGTGTAISFGLQTIAGTYTVVAINTATSCSNSMAGSATVTVISAPAIHSVTGGGSYCVGSTGMNVGLSSSSTGVSYQLYRSGSPVGSPLSGTGSALSFGTFTIAGTYTVMATGSGSCTSAMAGSATITVNSLPTAYTVSGGGSYCAGGSGMTVGLSGSASGINYQLFRGTTPVGSAVAGTGTSISFGLQTVAGTYTVVATNATTGCTSNMTGSVTISVVSAPTAFTVTGGGSYCSGPGYHVYLSGSQTGVTYRLYLGTTAVGSPISGTGTALDFGLYTTVGTYTVIGSSSTSSCATTMAGSASITAGSLPTLFSVTGGGSFCSGGSGYAVGLSGSQTGVSYQLYRGTSAVGTPVAGTGSAISFGAMTIAGGYTVVATNPTTGCIRSMSGSATITVNSLPTVYTVTGGGSYCSGGTGVAIGLSGSTSGISYKLYRGTTLVATVSGTGTAISFGSHSTAATYTVVALNVGTGCTSNMSGSATVVVNTTPIISGSIFTVAPSSSITLTGTPSGGTWTSSATAVATVSGGVVTGVSLGSTTISYTMSTGCRATRTVSVTPTGFRQDPGVNGMVINEPGADIHIVPNPNHGVFSIKGNLSKSEDTEVSLEITNMLGQVIYSGKVIAKNGELDEVVHLNSTIANGMYLLNVSSTGGGKVFHVIVEK